MTDRVFSIGQKHERAAADGGDLIVDMAFASEEPYERWWGIEKLVVSDKAVRLDRLNDGAPLLYNHDWSDLRGTHVPGSVKAESDGVLRGKVRITSATQTGRDTIALVESGVLTKASVGYQIHAIIEQTTGKGGEKVERHIDGAAFERLIDSHSVVRNGRRMPGDLAAFRRALDEHVARVTNTDPIQRAADEPTVYLVTDWEPLEDSLVTIPADNTVGVGRSAAGWVDPAAERAADAEAIRTGLATSAEAAATTEVTPQAADEPAAEPVPPQAAANTRSANMAEVLNPAAQTAEQPDALKMEQQRKLAIQQLVKANRLDPRTEQRWIEDGLPLTEVAEKILAVLEERGKTKPQSAADLGMTLTEQRRYSMFRVLRMLSATNQVEAQRFQQEAAFEIECSRSVAKQLGREPDGLFVPAEILRRPVDTDIARRTMTAVPGAAGGYMVETENMGFVDILRNRSVLSAMGARTLSGLVGNVTIPRQTGAGTLVWQAGETTAATAADQTLGQLSMTPKTAIALTQIGRTLMLQSSPSAESMVMADLAQVVALGVDLAGVAGTGGAQPIGIINTSGITTGQDAATATYAKILAFQSVAAGNNAILDGAGYVTTPAVAAANMGRSRFANTDTPLWDGNILDGRMAGFKAMSSVQIPASNMIFGSFGQVVIGEWGVLELTMNPYQSFGAGVVAIRAIYTVDVLLRYPQAFVLSTNAS